VSNNNGFEHKFEEITHKIDDLKSNMMNSSMENLMEMFNKGKSDEMIEEQQEGAEGQELIDYMAANHDLLRKIHSTMQEYTELKEEIKNAEYMKRSPLEEMRTPSKF
jgi:mevalonate kinase